MTYRSPQAAEMHKAQLLAELRDKQTQEDIKTLEAAHKAIREHEALKTRIEQLEKQASTAVAPPAPAATSLPAPTQAGKAPVTAQRPAQPYRQVTILSSADIAAREAREEAGRKAAAQAAAARKQAQEEAELERILSNAAGYTNSLLVGQKPTGQGQPLDDPELEAVLALAAKVSNMGALADETLSAEAGSPPAFQLEEAELEQVLSRAAKQVNQSLGYVE